MRDKAGRIADRLQDLREAIANIRSDIGASSRDEFLGDGKTQRAVIESLIVIGEAANNLIKMAPKLEQDNPALWQIFRDAYDMRIVLTHEYFRVDASVVWDTVLRDLPDLDAALGQIDGLS
jgi:uncharacterized protein with HEPN domain